MRFDVWAYMNAEVSTEIVKRSRVWLKCVYLLRCLGKIDAMRPNVCAHVQYNARGELLQYFDFPVVFRKHDRHRRVMHVYYHGSVGKLNYTVVLTNSLVLCNLFFRSVSSCIHSDSLLSHVFCRHQARAFFAFALASSR